MEEKNEIIAELEDIIGTVENLNTGSWDEDNVAFIHELIDRAFSIKRLINETSKMITAFREKSFEEDIKTSTDKTLLNRKIY